MIPRPRSKAAALRRALRRLPPSDQLLGVSDHLWVREALAREGVECQSAQALLANTPYRRSVRVLVDAVRDVSAPRALLRAAAEAGDGRVVVVDRVRDRLGLSAAEPLLTWLGPRNHDREHSYGVPAAAWERLFWASGLEIERYERVTSFLGSRFVALLRPWSSPEPPDLGEATWEAAYAAFETPEQERRKIRRRLEHFGARDWSRGLRVVDLFCGAGCGLHALDELGFTQIEGVDRSSTLLARYEGPALCHLADCRELPFEDSSRDVLMVNGGLHHLETLGDLRQVCAEVRRVLRPGGRFCVVEPWRTPFLDLVHALTALPGTRVSRTLAAFETLYAHEHETYDRWLARPRAILGCLEDAFEVERLEERWGKLVFAGRPRAR